MRSVVFASLLASLLVPAVAVAQPAPRALDDVMPTAPDDQSLDPRALALPAPIPERKNPTTAMLASAVPTAIGWAMVGVAALDSGRGLSHDEANANAALGMTGWAFATIGPSAGHFYAGGYVHGALTTLGRVGATVGVGAGLVTMFEFCSASESTHCAHQDEPLGYAIIGASVALYVGLTAYDLIDAPAAARRANQRDAQISVMPTMIRGSRDDAPGLALTGTF